MSDRIFGGIGLALAIFFIWQATAIQESFIQDAVGPKTFPIIIGAVMALSSAYLILRPDADPLWPRAAGLIEIGMAALVMFSYALALPELGFGTSTALAAAYLTWRLDSPPLQAIIAGVLISGGLWVVFRLVLGLSLARGPLGF
jgi:putative tricarboxylic transport membrane protein